MSSLVDFKGRFWAADAQIRKIEAEQMAPLRQRLDAKRAEIQRLQSDVKALSADLAKVRAPLAVLENEKAALSRACKGKVGEPT